MTSWTTESVVRKPGQLELSETRHDLERKAPALPVLVDRRLDLGLHEVSYAVQVLLLVVVEQSLQPVEIGAVGRRRGTHRRYLNRVGI
jgi:hypothetical protein